jgi:hypothetical protein
VAGRAAVITVIGLSLGSLRATVAVILAYYGVLFLTAVPVLGWTARRLAVLAACCALAAPLLSQWLRTSLPDVGKGDNVQWADLGDPWRLVGSIVLFGYYPVLTWTAYLFAGIAVGRCRLGRPATAARVAVAGAVLAVVGLGAQALARSLAGGTVGLGQRLGLAPAQVDRVLSTSSFGTAPTGSWWWLLLAGRHSGSGPDLLHTGGSALLVLGCCLLVVPRLGRRAGVVCAPLVAAGSMTLTLYTMHVLVLEGTGSGGGRGQVPSSVVLPMHVVCAAWIAMFAGVSGRRGPLERVAAAAGVAAARIGAAGRREGAGGSEGAEQPEVRAATVPGSGRPPPVAATADPPPATPADPEAPAAPGDAPPSDGTPPG